MKYSELTPTEIEAAKMTKASYINLTEGQHASHAYASEHIKGWQLDTSLSDEHTSVFMSREGKVAIAYRGTQAGRDWKTNAQLAVGTEESSQQIQEIERQFQKVVKKYGKEKVEFFTGHSKGGGLAIFMGNKHGISTITQDPALTPKMIANSNKNVHHVVNRTPTDWVSGLTSTATLLRDNFTKRLIKPDKGTGILGSHDVNLMTHFDYRPTKGSGNTDYDEATQNAKDKTFIEKHVEQGMTFNEIEDKVGYRTGGIDHEKFIAHYNEVIQNPSPGEYYKTAGYSTEANSLIDRAKGVAKDKVVAGVESLTSKVGTAATSVLNRSTGANIVSSIGTAYALQGMGANEDLNYVAHRLNRTYNSICC